MNKITRYTFVAFTVLLSVLNGCRKSEYIIDTSDIVVTDNGNGVGTTTWEKGKEYILEGKVFVNDGQVLTIEPGTVIKARRGQGAASSALIVARGGKIIAEGTAVDPIIFTTEGDDLEGSVATDERGLWGGLIILGSATLNTPDGEAHIEGISHSEPRGIFGGNNDTDNSGILKYVSIRHGGTDLGQDNEINGLTLGGVGSSTTIEHVEVIANADDGIEIFGGTVNIKNIVVALCNDDAIDIDMGYRGKGQFICLLQGENHGDKLLEIDGGEKIKTARPYTLPVFYNITAVGRGETYSNWTISFNDNAGGTIANSVFYSQHFGVLIEYSGLRTNSFTQWENENLNISGNFFYDINKNNKKEIFHIIALNDEDITSQQAKLDSYFSTAGNQIVNPDFSLNESGISMIPAEEAILSEGIALPDDEFWEDAPYRGAMQTYNWVGEWTLTYQVGLIW